MSKRCPIRKERVLYIDCLECEDRSRCDDLVKEDREKRKEGEKENE